MAKLQVPYTIIKVRPNKLYPAGRLAYRPMLRTQLTSSAGQTQACSALVDSGADACLFRFASLCNSAWTCRR